ncbi:MAG: hypothetical protein KDD47_15865, partial [Acidobacteria bacterium]|nr:hypothetical protein [Acidobacteriota bacterium]
MRSFILEALEEPREIVRRARPDLKLFLRNLAENLARIDRYDLLPLPPERLGEGFAPPSTVRQDHPPSPFAARHQTCRRSRAPGPPVVPEVAAVEGDPAAAGGPGGASFRRRRIDPKPFLLPGVSRQSKAAGRRVVEAPPPHLSPGQPEV